MLVLVVVVWVRGKAMLVSIALRVLLSPALVPGSFVFGPVVNSICARYLKNRGCFVFGTRAHIELGF